MKKRIETPVRIDWHKFIAADPEVHHGEPCIKGTGIPASMIVRSLKDGMTSEDILKEYPQLNEESIQAALSYELAMVWERLMKIGEKLSKGWKSEKSAVEILSEMRR